MVKKQLLKKTAVISASTMLSRFFGIIRETLTIRYLGATALADAFLTAYKIPNTLRKAFAEGALSAAVVPVLTSRVHEHGKASINGLMMLFFIIFELCVLALCIVGVVWAKTIIQLIAPGFMPETVEISAQMLRIVMPFILSVSMSALFAGALQSDNRFLIPALAPVFLNIVIISTLLICLGFKLPVTVLCWGILVGGILQCIIHLIAYLQAGFGFAHFTHADLKTVRTVMVRFLLCLPSISLMELSSFIDTSFASVLKPGSIALIYLANRVVGIPLGVFAVAFATVLLPHMSRVVQVAPKRLSFYLLESAKLIFWICLPATLLLCFFAQPLFATVFLVGGKFNLAQVSEAATILCAFGVGLFFFSFNKVILNSYYALHITWVPAVIAACTAATNVLLNWLFIGPLQATGLALATSLSAVLQTILLLVVLQYGYKKTVYLRSFATFCMTYSMQAAFFFIPFWILYQGMEYSITHYTAGALQWFLLQSLGYWLWTGPLSCIYLGLLWYYRSWMNQRLYFLQ
jgi:putative peptidoglycan lipid II flippase